MNIEPLESRIAPAVFVVTALTDVIADDAVLTLREAVAAANDTPAADMIKFDPALAGTLTLALGSMNITETLTIIGGGKITLSGNNAVRIFSVNNADTVKDHPLTVSGLRFAGGNAGGTNDGGAINSSEGLTILNCTFAKNTAGGEGGAVRVVTPTGFVVVKDSHFSDNSSTNGAGGLQAGSAKGITVTGSVFAGNEGGFAGGASLGVESENGKITVSGCTFVQNDSTIAGGGLSVGGNWVSIANSTFSGNTADLHGGGLSIAGGAYSLTGLKFLGNSAPMGGAISSTAGANSITLSKSLLEGNVATGAGGGGGIYLTGAVEGFAATITSTQIIGNAATAGSGGGIRTLDTGGKITVTGSLISGNTASSSGGGIAIIQNDLADPVIATLTGNTVSGNNANSAGGLFLSRYGDFILTKNVIAGNRANNTGGLDFDLIGDLTMKSNQVVGNRSVSRTGGLNFVADATSTFTNSGNVIAYNEGGETGGISLDSAGDITIAKNTKITGNIAGSGTRGGGLTQGGGGAVTLLAPVLGNYNRVNSAFDQTAGTLTGAPIPLPSVAANITVTTLADSGAGSLRDAIAQANDTPAADIIKFDDSLKGVITLASVLEIDEPLTIYGRGQITLSGNDATRILAISNPSDKDRPVTVSGLTFTKGASTFGGAIIAYHSLTVLDCLFVDNDAGTTTGGAIFVELDKASLTIKNSHFLENSGGAGGALHASSNKAITVVNTVFSENVSGGDGGGANLVATAPATKISVIGSLFTDNGSLGKGAGLALRGSVEDAKFSKALVVNSSFVRNGTASDGGGLRLEQGGFALAGVQIINNTAGAVGGGLTVADVATKLLTVSKSLIAGNDAGGLGGGGVYLGQNASGFAATFTATQILGNTTANGFGGGIYANGLAGKLTVLGSLLAGNSAEFGGGLATSGTGTDVTSMVLTGNTFAGNEAKSGGGIYTDGDGPIALTKNSIIANLATTDVGGARLESAGLIALKTNSILGNRSDNGIGGVLLRGPASASFTASGDLIAFNEGTTGGLEIEQAIAGIIAKNVRITGNIALGTFNGGGITQESAGVVQLLATVLGNLNRLEPTRNETFGIFGP